MKKQLTLDLTPKQYQQLVETVFVGTGYIEDRWGSEEDCDDLLQQILEQADVFGKKAITIAPPELDGMLYICRDLEIDLTPYMYDDTETDIFLN